MSVSGATRFGKDNQRCLVQSSIDPIKRVGVIGSGQMGVGIAFVVASVTKLPVVLMDISRDQTERGLQFMRMSAAACYLSLTNVIDRLLEKNVAKSKMTSEDAEQTRQLVSTTNALSGLNQVDFVIEAASENLAIKTSIFRDLSATCKPDTILASNTSSISITKIAAATNRAEKVLSSVDFGKG